MSGRKPNKERKQRQSQRKPPPAPPRRARENPIVELFRSSEAEFDRWLSTLSRSQLRKFRREVEAEEKRRAAQRALSV